MSQSEQFRNQFTVVIPGVGDVYQDTNQDHAMLAYDEWCRRSFCDPNSDAFGHPVQLFFEGRRVA